MCIYIYNINIYYIVYYNIYYILNIISIYIDYTNKSNIENGVIETLMPRYRH